MSKKVKIPKAIKGFGYSGVWQNGEIGWNVTQYIDSRRRYVSPPDSTNFIKGERAFLCEIIIRPVKDKKGRPITKIMK